MKVTMKPAPKKAWHGKEGKESFARPQSLEVLYDVESGHYATGLTPEEEVKYGKLLGVNLSNIFNPEEPHEYWSSNAAKIRLPNHTFMFDTTRAADYVKVKNLKASKMVANSFKEWEEGLWPDATHILTDETEEVGIEASKIQLKNKCIEVLMKMSLDEKINILTLLHEKSAKGRSNDYVDVELDKIINNRSNNGAGPEEFAKWAKMEKAEVYTRAKLREGLDRHVLTKDGGSIKYMGETIGYDFDDAVKYFMDPDNQSIKAIILEKLS